MQKIRDRSTNQVVGFLYFQGELCEILNCTSDDLRAWADLMPPSGTQMHPDREIPEAVYKVSLEDVEQYKRYAAIIRTGMTPAQVAELQSRDEKSRKAGKAGNFVDMYARLAAECPPGITAHAMRSYCTVLLAQNRHDKTLMVSELARAAQIPETTAKRHLQYLQKVGMLKFNVDQKRWEFRFVPAALSKHLPE